MQLAWKGLTKLTGKASSIELRAVQRCGSKNQIAPLLKPLHACGGLGNTHVNQLDLRSIRAFIGEIHMWRTVATRQT